ncbi:MAG: malate dehydrogenase [Bdellovibrionaceae bacterium]|nr:malate dehydrogenase [Pseudobdellovibrionaceae bacterium]|tara:strand:- start:40420 stop:41364 length:945 start_codon:yes stop_codon:yes gene_type:complete
MSHKRKKITVIGAGFVGSTAAHWAASKELGDVVLLDINEGAAQGKALDLFEASPVEGFDSRVTGTADYKDSAGSDVVIITAGIPRKPGMSRDDLLATNAKIMKTCCEGVKEYSPNATVIVVANPLDAMCHVAYDTLGFPKNRVVGMAGVLDSARFRSFIAEAANVSVKDVNAFVLGGHGDTMVPLPRYCSIGGAPLDRFLSEEKIEALVDRTRKGGAEIVGLLKTGSAYYAPSASAVEMAEAILKDQKRILPCACLLEGEFGYKDLFIGVLCQLGGDGVEKVVELELTEPEQAMLKNSADAVQGLVDALKGLDY